MEIIIVLSILIIFAVASVLWGHDSRDTVNSDQWKRRQNFFYEPRPR